MVRTVSILHSKVFSRRLSVHHRNNAAVLRKLPSSSSGSGSCIHTTSAAAQSDAERKEFEQKQDKIKQELREEAAFLSKSLYRTCLRSVRLIRPGNEHDEEEFQRREKERLEEETGPRREEDARLGMFSMLPPVDREDELNSRAEYYHQYARENFVQEKDCLPFEDDIVSLRETHIARFMYFLKKGEKDRKWLLNDYGFPDPYENYFPSDRAKAFEKKALAYVRENVENKRQLAGVPMYDECLQEEDVGDDDDEDGSESDSDSEEYPAWFKEKYPDMGPKRR